ncbi:hypothetical protein I5R48_00035 [Bacillus velezensis]|nr:hypothetical protein I5R48_00035 [Bacillus velezensis]
MKTIILLGVILTFLVSILLRVTTANLKTNNGKRVLFMKSTLSCTT